MTFYIEHIVRNEYCWNSYFICATSGKSRTFFNERKILTHEVSHFQFKLGNFFYFVSSLLFSLQNSCYYYVTILLKVGQMLNVSCSICMQTERAITQNALISWSKQNVLQQNSFVFYMFCTIYLLIQTMFLAIPCLLGQSDSVILW